MKKIWFIGLLALLVLVSGCYGPQANINTTVQQTGGTPTETPYTIISNVTTIPTATVTPYATPIMTETPVATANATSTPVATV